MSDVNHTGLPEMVGNYKVKSRLSTGSKGDVLLAFDERLDRKVAIRRVSREAEPELIQRFLSEARSAARLSHPSIARVHDVFEDEDGANIVVEYVEGHSLSSMLRRGPLDSENVVKLAAEIAGALDEAHRHSLNFGHISIDNIIITITGRVKIIDFGLMKERTEMLLTSPEQARGETPDHRATLFSLGSLMYEMMAGDTPYRGATDEETRDLLIRGAHQPLNQVLRDAGDDVSSLVDRLLQKNPDDRPLNARKTMVYLRRMVDYSITLSSAGFDTGTYSMPPGSYKDQSSGSFSQTNPLPEDNQPKRKKTLVWLAPAVLVVITSLLLWRFPVSKPPPLRVVTLKPEVLKGSSEADLMALNVQEAVLNTLISLESVSPIDPEQISEHLNKDVVAIARAAAADEVLKTTVSVGPDLTLITFHRLDGSDGSLIWDESFQAPSGANGALMAAEAVMSRIQRAWRAYKPRDGFQHDARDDDYAELLEIRRKLQSPEIGFYDQKEQIDAILESSPRFMSAYMVAGFNALTHYNNSGNLTSLELSAGYRDRAARINPQDIRLQRLSFQLALARDEYEEAEIVLARLEQLEPTSVDSLVLRSMLLEKKGDLNGSIEILDEAVTRRPDWRNLYRLAKLEMKAGMVHQSRAHLEKLLEITPGVIWGMVGLAGAEMMYGDLTKAERLFDSIVKLRPHKSFYASLATTRFLRGNFEAAITAYEKALELAPEDPSSMLGLADSQFALGNKDQALGLYQKTLEILNLKEESASLTAIELLIRAQCLAHLGQFQEAVSVTLVTLQANPDHAELVFQAAGVYALSGEITSALACARSALEKGIQPRWFSSPIFNELRTDARFLEMLGAQAVQ